MTLYYLVSGKEMDMIRHAINEGYRNSTRDYDHEIGRAGYQVFREALNYKTVSTEREKL